LPQQYGVEVGGGLGKLGDGYFYSSPHAGDSTTVANLEAGLPPGTELVGVSHTPPRLQALSSL